MERWIWKFEWSISDRITKDESLTGLQQGFEGQVRPPSKPGDASEQHAVGFAITIATTRRRRAT